MKTLVRPLLTMTVLLAASVGCSGRGETDAKRAEARIEFIVYFGGGGTIEYDEEAPDRPMIGLSFPNSQILDAGLRAVGRVKTLRRLDLSSTERRTPRGLSYLRELTNLTDLSLRLTFLTDPSLEHVGALPALRVLDLGDNPTITDAGLRHLRGLKDLRTLILDGTAVTDAGVEELKTYLTEVEVRR